MPDPWSTAGPAPGGSPPPDASPTPAGRRRPGRWAYVVGGLLVLLSVVGSITALAIGLTRAIDVRPLPASGVAVLPTDAGEEVGVYASRGSTSSVACRATVGDGTEVPIAPPLGSVTITRGSVEYEAIGRLRTPTGGGVRLDCSGVPGAATGPAPNVLGAVGLAFAVIGAGIVGSLLGLGTVLTAFLMRRRGPRP